MTVRLALIGSPVAGSPSPAMHLAAAEALGLDIDYRATEVAPADLRGHLAGLRRTHRGLNVTRPLKERVLPLLDEVSAEAAEAGSVNTVVFEDDRAIGHSTDGAGFLAALRRAGVGRVGRALVLGTGGAARAVVAALRREGATVTVAGRNAAAGRRLAADLGVAFGFTSRETLDAADLLVNATPVGGEAPGEPHDGPLPPRLAVADLVVRPVRTALLARAEAAGCRIVPGIEMLVEQGARSFELWTGRAAPTDVMRAAALAAIGHPVRSPR